MSSTQATVGSSGDNYDFPESTVSDYTRSKTKNYNSRGGKRRARTARKSMRSKSRKARRSRRSRRSRKSRSRKVRSSRKRTRSRK